MAAEYVPELLSAARDDLNEGRWEAAVGRLRDVAVDLSEPAKVRALALNDLGVVAHHQGEWSRSRRLLEASLVLDDTVAVTHVNLGQALERLGRPGEAVAAYRAALWCDPAEPGVAMHLRRAATKVGEPRLASTVLDQLAREHRLVLKTERDLGFLRNDYHPPRRATLRRLYVEAARVARRGRVMEWGCATGIGCVWLADEGCVVTGVSESRNALTYARRRHDHDRVAYVRRGRLGVRPTGDRGFDLVMSRAPDGGMRTAERLLEHVAADGCLLVPESWIASGVPEGTRVVTTLQGPEPGMPGAAQALRCLARSAPESASAATAP